MPHKQRPDDGGMVAGGHAQAGVAVDDLGAFGGDGNVGQQAGHQPRAHGRAVHGADDGFVAVDDVVDQVARFLPHPGAHGKVAGHVLHQGQVAAARETHALAAQHGAAHRVVSAMSRQISAQLPVTVVAGGGQLSVLRLHLDVQHRIIGATAREVEGLVA
jgi:hypothetical protein